MNKLAMDSSSHDPQTNKTGQTRGSKSEFKGSVE
jgi:hypothetical protein